MALGYDTIKVVKDMVNQIPYNNDDLYYIQKNMLKPYKKEEFENIKHQTSIFKINQRVSSDDANSLYRHILNDDL